MMVWDRKLQDSRLGGGIGSVKVRSSSLESLVQFINPENFHGVPISMRREQFERIIDRKCAQYFAKTERAGHLEIVANLPPKREMIARLLVFCSVRFRKGAVLMKVEDQKGEDTRSYLHIVRSPPYFSKKKYTKCPSYANFSIIWFGMVRFGYILVWFGMVLNHLAYDHCPDMLPCKHIWTDMLP